MVNRYHLFMAYRRNESVTGPSLHQVCNVHQHRSFNGRGWQKLPLYISYLKSITEPPSLSSGTVLLVMNFKRPKYSS